MLMNCYDAPEKKLKELDMDVFLDNLQVALIVKSGESENTVRFKKNNSVKKYA